MQFSHEWILLYCGLICDKFSAPPTSILLDVVGKSKVENRLPKCTLNFLHYGENFGKNARDKGAKGKSHPIVANYQRVVYNLIVIQFVRFTVSSMETTRAGMVDGNEMRTN